AGTHPPLHAFPTRRSSDLYEGDYARLQQDLNSMADKIADVVRRISEATEQQNSTAAEISSGSQDLAQRTESQAASIEETAASMRSEEHTSELQSRENLVCR